MFVCCSCSFYQHDCYIFFVFFRQSVPTTPTTRQRQFQDQPTTEARLITTDRPIEPRLPTSLTPTNLDLTPDREDGKDTSEQKYLRKECTHNNSSSSSP